MDAVKTFFQNFQSLSVEERNRVLALINQDVPVDFQAEEDNVSSPPPEVIPDAIQQESAYTKKVRLMVEEMDQIESRDIYDDFTRDLIHHAPGLIDQFPPELIKNIKSHKGNIVHTFNKNKNGSYSKYHIGTTTIKGGIQSGKTENMRWKSMLLNHLGYNTIILTRGLNVDKEQFLERAEPIYREIFKVPEDQYDDLLVNVEPNMDLSLYPLSKARCFVSIASASCIDTLFEHFQTINKGGSTIVPFVLFIDESDYVDTERSTQKDKALLRLKNMAKGVYNVSATVMDNIARDSERISDNNFRERESTIEIIPLPSNYKGIREIKFAPTVPSGRPFANTVSTDLLVADETLTTYIESFVEKPFVRDSTHSLSSVGGTTYLQPNITLISICSNVQPNIKAAKTLAEKHPSALFVAYNGKGIHSFQAEVQTDYKLSISKYLRKIQNEVIEGISPMKNVIIFCGELANRGVSFVSFRYPNDLPSFHSWHLSEMRLLVPNATCEPDLLQKVRLCGIYNDSIELVLHSTTEIIEEIRYAFYKQEEMVVAIQTQQATLTTYPMHNDKFTKRKMFKDNRLVKRIKLNKTKEECGWNYDNELPPDEYFILNGIVPSESVSVPSEKERIASENILYSSNVEENIQVQENQRLILVANDTNLTVHERDTYQLIVDYFIEKYEDSYTGGWTMRSDINHWMQNKHIGTEQQLSARMDHLRDKGTTTFLDNKCGIMFKQVDGRWKIKIIK